MGETTFRVPESVKKSMLRDAGHAPEDWHPDAHFRRETPLGQSAPQPNLSATRQTISPEAARIGKAMLRTTDIGRGHTQ